MLIGELARRTNTSERLLRYYERVGLLSSDRLANGYRDYADDAERVVGQIRSLLAAGLPTRVIRHIIPCAREDGSLAACPGVLDRMRSQLEQLDQRADELAVARETLVRAIRTTETHVTL
ncbi:MerR family transcriptional regulator [Fodinicola feengrottensis]|uniref:HTH merR-type domain-containing protein n=1 Tax=Fodinicola feengrottensis TaxID=435914 RepID=A0ABP4S9C9_9ACTN|nr:MerR family transcriptional regulator [Fodinicola feengrottensis]